MRWDALFADLEGQLESERGAAFQAEVAELTRAERASVELSARLIAARGLQLTIRLTDGEVIQGEIRDAAAQWILLMASARYVLIPVGAVALVQGLPTRARPASHVERRLTLGHALRALSRDRARVVVRVAGGAVSGLVDTVGADYVEITQDEGVVAALPFAAIVSVRAG